MGKAYLNNLQYPIELEGSSDAWDILVEGQLSKQSADFE